MSARLFSLIDKFTHAIERAPAPDQEPEFEDALLVPPKDELQFAREVLDVLP